jgi:hypothetical protein
MRRPVSGASSLNPSAVTERDAELPHPPDHRLLTYSEGLSRSVPVVIARNQRGLENLSLESPDQLTQ